MDGYFATDSLDLQRLTAELAPLGAAHDRDASFPFDALARLHAAGLMGLTVSRALGGAEAPLSHCLSLVEAVAQGCPATALVFTMQLIHQRVLAHSRTWPAALRDKVGRDAVENGALLNALRVEPGLGSPSRGGLPETTASRAPGGWVLNGRKIYSTGSPGLTWFMVWARTDEDATPNRPASPSSIHGTIWACAPPAAMTWCSTAYSSRTSIWQICGCPAPGAGRRRSIPFGIIC
jgi:alkylation response protein AidB-like acyl-CoA dehydrogenase